MDTAEWIRKAIIKCPSRVTVPLAWSILYDVKEDKLVGTEVVTFKAVETSKN